MKHLGTVLPLLALFAMGAAPRSSFVTATPMPDFSPPPKAPPPATVPPGFVTAPTPDQDAFSPTSRASHDASLAPGVFTRRDQYRGEGLSGASSSQVQQDRKALPGAGIKLSMPLQ